MGEPWRPDALTSAVALVAAKFHGVDIDPTELTEDIPDRELVSALVWLCTQLVEHSRGDLGPLVLRVAGIAAATGGGDTVG